MLKWILPLLFIAGVTNASESNNYSEMARSRHYVGGADESDLKVQAALVQTPSAKKKKKSTTTEPVEGF